MILFNRTFLFFIALLFVISANTFFCGSCLAKEFSAEEEYNAQKKLLQLQYFVDDEDYVKAQFIFDNFQNDFRGTNIYKKYSKKINELAKKIKKNTKNIKFEDKIEYIFVPANLESKLWKEYISKAERLLVFSREDKSGMTIVRVIFENEDAEAPSVSVVNGNDTFIYHPYGGFNSVAAIKSGDAIFLGSRFGQYSGMRDPNKSISTVANIVIGGAYHYATKLKIKVQKGKVLPFGEIIVRSVPQEYNGNLIVKVKAEEGLNLANAAVSLKVNGAYSGITKPVTDGSCLFSAVGPGSYSVGITSNDALGGPGQSATVISGRTTEVTVNAYRNRIIEFEWCFRSSNDPNWLYGQKIMETKESWQPDGEWPGVSYPVISLGDWLGDTCKIRSSNGNLMYVDSNEPFEEVIFPSYFSKSYRDYMIKEGDVFAWRREDYRQKKNFVEALIRIRKITPVGEKINHPEISSIKEEKTESKSCSLKSANKEQIGCKR